MLHRCDSSSSTQKDNDDCNHDDELYDKGRDVCNDDDIGNDMDTLVLITMILIVMVAKTKVTGKAWS
jgi:hypothetical protein